MSKEESSKNHKDLKEHGIIYLAGGIDESLSENVCKEIIEYNISGKVECIQMIINSHGGSCTDGFAIIDIMEWSRLPVYTTGIGMICSMALLIFMTGAKGRRVITPRTSILSHRYSTKTQGNHSQLLADRKEQDLMHERVVDHYLHNTHIDTREKLEGYLLRDVDTWLSTGEALEYGIADIVEPLSRDGLEIKMKKKTSGKKKKDRKDTDKTPVLFGRQVLG